MSGGDGRRPLVSVILAVCNEARHIESVVGSLMSQSRPAFDLEILVVDSNSTDGTSEILERMALSHPELKLLRNPRRMTPFAFNTGLRHARGEYVCIFGAHTVYDLNYISTCLSEMELHGAIGCGGRVLTTAANTSLQARLVAASLGSVFGTSNKSFRNYPQGYADTINYPVYVRDAVVDVGGYDESLYRNQDNDLNQRLRAKGHRLYVTWSTSCRYFVQSTIAQLAQYAWKTGYWNVIGLKKNASAHGVRHFVPGMFVSVVSLTSLFALLGMYVPIPFRGYATMLLLVLLGTYFAAALVSSSFIAARRKWFAALLLPPVFFALHVSYGLGTLWAFLCNAKSPEAPIADSVLHTSHRT